MGLSLEVGVYSGIEEADGSGHFDRLFAAIAQAMTDAGLPAHIEPKDAVSWTAQGHGYSGLHALREVAALLWYGMPIPRSPLISGQELTHLAEDLFNRALQVLQPPMPQKPKGLFARLFDKPGKVAVSAKAALPPFTHLIMHSDADGFYVPTDFPAPLLPGAMENITAPIWPLGSTQRLKAEIDILIKALEIPDDLGSQDEALWNALAHPVQDQDLWRAQPIAAYTAIILRDACKASVATGAAIAFV